MSTKDLYALALENGMTDEEFVKEVRECFATHMSLILDGMGTDKTYAHEFYFTVIECKKIKSRPHTVN